MRPGVRTAPCREGFEERTLPRCTGAVIGGGEEGIGGASTIIGSASFAPLRRASCSPLYSAYS